MRFIGTFGAFFETEKKSDFDLLGLKVRNWDLKLNARTKSAIMLLAPITSYRKRREMERKADIQQQRNYVVVKSNEMIQRARYDLNATELKTLAFIISKIKPTDTELQEYTFPIREFGQVCGIDYTSGKNYKRIKATLKGLRDKSFWIKDENGHETLVGWLQKARINKGSGKITVRLDEDMQKYVLGLFDNFTQYELLSTLPMKSAYSFRMYEILKSYSFAGGHTFNTDELKRQLAAEHYTNFKDFRTKVIEVAVKEINLYTDIEVSWEPITYGRKVIEVKFTIKQRDSWGRYMAATNATKELDGQLDIFDFLDTI